jgi:hypothetical protein
LNWINWIKADLSIELEGGDVVGRRQEVRRLIAGMVLHPLQHLRPEKGQKKIEIYFVFGRAEPIVRLNTYICQLNGASDSLKLYWSQFNKI